MSSLILVSNRLPVSAKSSGSDGVVLVRSSGGLVTGLGPLHDRSDTLWIGNLGARGKDNPPTELQAHRLVPVDLPREMARRYYNGFSNGVLWPVFHNFTESFRYDSRDFSAYKAVNKRFAHAIAEVAPASSLVQVWIHDYHLMLLPSMLRERLPRASIGFFLHTPFPPADVFEIIPPASELLHGLRGADLIGLHTRSYKENLEAAFRGLLATGAGDEMGGSSECRLEVHPIGVDARGFAERAVSESVRRRIRTWRRRVGNRKVILGVDRLDYTKGLPLRLAAFRRLLDIEPRWVNDSVYIQIAVPSRTTIPEYRLLKEDVERRVGEINGRHASSGGVPLWYLYRSIPPEEVSALYGLADVLLVTPLRDGMNLVAKEYVASRVEDTGVLVLSRFAGAASELEGSCLVNPWDDEGTARTLDRALRMEVEEQRTRMIPMRRRVMRQDAVRWGQKFVEALGRVRSSRDRGMPAVSSHHSLLSFTRQ